jgi:hypothetical protein
VRQLSMQQTSAAAANHLGPCGSLAPALLPRSGANGAARGPLETREDHAGVEPYQQPALTDLKDTKDVAEAVQGVMRLLKEMQVKVS